MGRKGERINEECGSDELELILGTSMTVYQFFIACSKLCDKDPLPFSAHFDPIFVLKEKETEWDNGKIYPSTLTKLSICTLILFINIEPKFYCCDTLINKIATWHITELLPMARGPLSNKSNLFLFPKFFLFFLFFLSFIFLTNRLHNHSKIKFMLF